MTTTNVIIKQLENKIELLEQLERSLLEPPEALYNEIISLYDELIPLYNV